ncbi:ribosome assembly protein 3 [Monosporozyma unispora]|nr:ribosome assembly protein 3 [Kazachstania unispora]
MSAGDISVSKSNNAKKSRRRKKRRTADVSDSSDSDSSSGSDNEIHDEDVVMEDQDQQPVEQHLSDIELSDDESVKKVEHNDELLSQVTKEKLANIPFTTTELTERFNQNHKYDVNHNTDFKKVSETIKDTTAVINKDTPKATNADLQNEYLGMLFQNYGDDINSLRDAPDFTNKSLVLLANVLKDGSKMFDVDTLKTIVGSK